MLLYEALETLVSDQVVLRDSWAAVIQRHVADPVDALERADRVEPQQELVTNLTAKRPVPAAELQHERALDHQRRPRSVAASGLPRLERIVTPAGPGRREHARDDGSVGPDALHGRERGDGQW
jgi:hypothetical protein